MFGLAFSMVERIDLSQFHATFTIIERAAGFAKAVSDVFALRMTECFERLDAAIDRSRG
jgi:hypothetical protein